MSKVSFVVVLLFFLKTSNSHAQNLAYYIGDYFGYELVLADLDKHRCIENAWIYGDSLYEANSQNILNTNFELCYFPEEWKLQPTEEVEKIKTYYGTFRQKSIRKDSIEIEGDWHAVYSYYFDDGFIGGRQNHITSKIFVEGLGMIYSSDNFINNHNLLMFRCQDSSKQILLEASLQWMENFKGIPLPWKKLIELSSKSSFDALPSDWFKKWKATQQHLQLVSCEYTYHDNVVTLKARVKNVSNLNYYFPARLQIAPSKAKVYFGEKIEESNLLRTHYGSHYRPINKDVLILSGQEYEFTSSFTKHHGCGSCTDVKYEGLQFFNNVKFISWTLSKPSINEGVEQVIFPHREVLAVE